MNKTLVDDSKAITKMLKKNKQIEDNFMEVINKLVKDIDQFRKDHSFLERNKQIKSNAQLDIVDASYNFRLLKLRTLKKKCNEDEEILS